MAGESVLAKMAVEISGNTASFAKSLNSAQKDLKSFTTGVANIAKTIGVAFAAKEVAQFAFEVSKLAGEAEGVRNAFDKLPGSVALMNNLKQATAGTVSELDLMKRSVQAANFGISLEALPKLLEFAAVRAQQTGQSVDYLVDSIVTGIGRKSPLILDNLGISAVALKEKMNGVSIATADVGQVAEAVGKIAAENLQTMGSMAETTATKTERLSASWTNFKVAIGDAANGTGVLGKSLDALTLSLDVASSSSLSFWEKLKAFTSGPAAISAYLEGVGRSHEKAAKQTKDHEQVIREVDRAYKEFGPNIDAYAKAIETHVLKTQLLEEYTRRLNAGNKEQVKTYDTLQESLKQLNAEFQGLDVNNTKQLQSTARQIVAINREIEALDALRKARLQEAQLQTKFGRDTFNKGPDAIGVNGVDPNDLMLSFKKPEGIEEMFPTEAIVSSADTVIKKLNEVGAIHTAVTNAIVTGQGDVEEAVSSTSQMFGDLGNMIVSSVGQSISANEKFADAMKRITKTIVSTMLARALSNAIAKSYESSKNPIIGTILAGAASAAVMALFAKIPGGQSSGASVPARTPTTVQNFQPSRSEQIVLAGDFKVRGRDLVLAIHQENKARERGG